MSAFAANLACPPRTLTDREVTLLLKVTGEHRDGFRDHVLFAMALGTGLREHELLALDVGDVMDSSGRAKRRVQLRVFKRSSQDESMQEVLLNDTLRSKLEKLLKLKQHLDEDVSPSAPLFVSRVGRRLSARMVRHGFGIWQERAGFERHFNFHVLRHTACTNLYRRTKDIRLTQRFARHKSITTTSVYTHASDDDLIRSLQDQPC